MQTNFNYADTLPISLMSNLYFRLIYNHKKTPLQNNNQYKYTGPSPCLEKNLRKKQIPLRYLPFKKMISLSSWQ